MHAHVDHHRPGSHVVRANQRLPADRCDQDLRLAGDFGEITGPRMADGHGGVGVQKEHSHRLADDVRSPNDDRPPTLELDSRTAEHLHDPGRGTGNQPGTPLLQ